METTPLKCVASKNLKWLMSCHVCMTWVIRRSRRPRAFPERGGGYRRMSWNVIIFVCTLATSRVKQTLTRILLICNCRIWNHLDCCNNNFQRQSSVGRKPETMGKWRPIKARASIHPWQTASYSEAQRVNPRNLPSRSYTVGRLYILLV